MSHELIAWCGFLGAWLLVAGPIYQAALELDDEEFEREDFERVAKSVEAPPSVSRWWLLIPPAAYVLRQRRKEAYKRVMLESMDRGELEKLMHFSETATAWMFVGSGAFLIAVKETAELQEAYEWSDTTFWLLIAGMIAVCVANIAVRVRRRHQIVEQAPVEGPRSARDKTTG